MARISRQALREADLTFTWKLVVRICSIVLAATAIGLVAWAESHAVKPVFSDPGDDQDGYGDGGSYWDDQDDNTLLPWVHIPLGLSIMWSLANIGVWFTPTRNGRGMHPGANVGCDLILWLFLLLTGVFASFAAYDYTSPWNEIDLDSYSGNTGSYGSYTSNGTEVADSSTCPPFLNCGAAADYNHQLNRKGIVIALGVTFTFIVMLCHFALFISACRYTHARRHERGGRYAKAVTDEATIIATKMIRDMGYPPPGQWPNSPPPQMPWSPQGEQQFAAARASMVQQPYSMQPKFESNPAEQGVQTGYQQQGGKGKAREDNMELGFTHGSTATDYSSSQPYPPTIRIDGAGDSEHSGGGPVS